MPDIRLIHGDCLDVLPTLPDNSVDAVVADLPYGITACSWDSIIPLTALWPEYRRTLKPNGLVILFAGQPFTTELINSNREWFRFCWYWDKVLAGGFLNANRRPLKVIEEIVVFSPETAPFFPQMTRRGIKRWKGGHSGSGNGSNTMGKYDRLLSHNNEYYPTNLITFSNGDRTRDEVGGHPTQKPVSLIIYLLQSHTLPSAVILDNAMGSGTTGVACVELGRSFIGIEKDAGYFEIAQARIAHAQEQTRIDFEEVNL